jgi:ribosome biogenesis protein MAK21
MDKGTSIDRLICPAIIFWYRNFFCCFIHGVPDPLPPSPRPLLRLPRRPLTISIMATFDDNALSKLTAKIDQKLSETKQGPKKKQSQRSLKSPQSKPDLKRKRQDDKPEHAAKKRTEEPKRNFKDKPDKKNKSANKKGPKSTQNGTSSNNVLLDEIRALGGDEQDLELVGDVDSEDETLGSDTKGNKLDKALQAELAKFASGLGFDKAQPEVAEEDEQDDEIAEDGNGDEWEEASEEDGVGDLTSQNQGKPPKPAPKGDWKTVSKPHHIMHLCDQH